MGSVPLAGMESTCFYPILLRGTRTIGRTGEHDNLHCGKFRIGQATPCATIRKAGAFQNRPEAAFRLS